MTNLLAIETSAQACSVALLSDDKLYSLVELTARQHTQQILPQITQLLLKAGITLQQLHAIAFSCGPGSFTGIRLGASVAQGLAFGANLPVIPISTLQTLAQGAKANFGASQVAVATDAYGSSVYWGVYQLGEQGIMQPMVTDTRCAPDGAFLPDDATSTQWIAVGDGWKAYQEILMAKFPTIQLFDCYPSAKDVLTLAKVAYSDGKYMLAEQVSPVYLYGADRWKKQ